MTKKTKFLIVDDVGSIRQLLKQYLKEIGFSNIVEFPDGEECWNFIAKDDNRTAEADFIIADLNMPKLNGVDLVKRVRDTKWGKKIPIILLTSENDRAIVASAIEAGISQYILKPFSKSTLVDKLVQAWEKHHRA